MGPQLAKRTACDRCRGKKLSCSQTSPGQGNTDANASTNTNAGQPGGNCVRCKRAGAQCTTSSARPLGRPRASGHAVPRRPDSFRILPPTHDGLGDSPPWTASSGMPSGSPSSEGRGDSADLQPLAAFQFPASPTESAGVNFGAAASMDLHTAYLTDLSWLLGQPTSTENNHNIDDADARFLHLGDGFDSFSPSFGHVTPQADRFNATSADLMVGLAHINESITKQLLAAETFPARSQQQQYGSDTPPAAGPSHISDALRITSDFVDLVRRQTEPESEPATTDTRWSASEPLTRSSISSGTNYDADSGLLSATSALTSRTPTSSGGAAALAPSRPAILLLLSGYMQMLQLYETIFRRVEEFLQGMSGQDLGACPGSANTPVSVSGIPQVDGRLQVRLVLQAVEHQLDTLGHHLGLPSEFCLSEGSEFRTGLLSGEDIGGLVQVAMGYSESATGASAKERADLLRNAIARVKSKA